MQTTHETKPMTEIEIELASDIVRVLKCPPGVRITIRDYDIDPDDEEMVSRDAQGRPFVEFQYEEEPI